MLVSQTRAVEQLIIVDTPKNIELKLGGRRNFPITKHDGSRV